MKFKDNVSNVEESVNVISSMEEGAETEKSTTNTPKDDFVGAMKCAAGLIASGLRILQEALDGYQKCPDNERND